MVLILNDGGTRNSSSQMNSAKSHLVTAAEQVRNISIPDDFNKSGEISNIAYALDTNALLAGNISGDIQSALAKVKQAEASNNAIINNSLKKSTKTKKSKFNDKTLLNRAMGLSNNLSNDNLYNTADNMSNDLSQARFILEHPLDTPQKPSQNKSKSKTNSKNIKDKTNATVSNVGKEIKKAVKNTSTSHTQQSTINTSPSVSNTYFTNTSNSQVNNVVINNNGTINETINSKIEPPIPESPASSNLELYESIKNTLIKKYNLSAEDAEILIKYLIVNGMPESYNTIKNIIVTIHQQNPNDFEIIFGNSLYIQTENGKILVNTTDILLDIFINLNSGNGNENLFIKQNGKTIINTKLIENNKFIPSEHIHSDGKINIEIINKYIKSENLIIKVTTLEKDKIELNSKLNDQIKNGNTLELVTDKTAYVILEVNEQGLYIDENSKKTFISLDKLKQDNEYQINLYSIVQKT